MDNAQEEHHDADDKVVHLEQSSSALQTVTPPSRSPTKDEMAENRFIATMVGFANHCEEMRQHQDAQPEQGLQHKLNQSHHRRKRLPAYRRLVRLKLKQTWGRWLWLRDGTILWINPQMQLIPIQEDDHVEQPPSWWMKDTMVFPLYTARAQELWPCGQSQEIKKQKPDLTKVADESEEIMKKSDQTENVPTVNDDGATINITNVTPHTKSFVLKLAVKNVDKWETVSTPVTVKFSGSGHKAVIEEWPAKFDPKMIVHIHPKKGSAYQLQVHAQGKKGDPELIGFFDYSSATLAKAFGIEEVGETVTAPVAPNAPVPVKTPKPAPAAEPTKKAAPQGDIEFVNQWLRSLDYEIRHLDMPEDRRALRTKIWVGNEIGTGIEQVELYITKLLDVYLDSNFELAKALDRSAKLKTQVIDYLDAAENELHRMEEVASATPPAPAKPAAPNAPAPAAAPTAASAASAPVVSALNVPTNLNQRTPVPPTKTPAGQPPVGSPPTPPVPPSTPPPTPPTPNTPNPQSKFWLWFAVILAIVICFGIMILAIGAAIFGPGIVNWLKKQNAPSVTYGVGTGVPATGVLEASPMSFSNNVSNSGNSNVFVNVQVGQMNIAAPAGLQQTPTPSWPANCKPDHEEMLDPYRDEGQGFPIPPHKHHRYHIPPGWDVFPRSRASHDAVKSEVNGYSIDSRTTTRTETESFGYLNTTEETVTFNFVFVRKSCHN